MNNEYSKMVTALCKSGQTIADEITANDAHILHMTIGISGEAGELLDEVKKHVIYRKPLDIENTIEELGDLEFYMEGLRQAIGVSREFVLKHNIDKLSKRYADLKYSDDDAINRVDKSVNNK